MNIKIKGKDVELKYTFNSFNYMGEFDLKGIEEMENKPFKIVPMLQILLMGAVNSSVKQKFSLGDVQAFIEKYMDEEESITDLLETLMTLLQESHFFKSLQKKTK